MGETLQKNSKTLRNLSNQNDNPELMKEQVILHELQTYFISNEDI